MKNKIKNTIQLLTLFCFSIVVAQTDIAQEELLIYNDSVQLPGTLTYNKTLKKQPLAIFIHGSGGVDRNGNQGPQFQANYIKQLSEQLNKNGIAFYRYDKRSSNMDNVKHLMKGIDFKDLIDDLRLAITEFKADSRFSEITLIGHSQGSLIGMLASKENVSKYVSLAGPSKSFDVTFVNQIRGINGDSAANLVQAHFNELKTNGEIKDLNPNLASLFNPINQRFFKGYINYVPTEEIKNVSIPTLILNGTMDKQVSEEDAIALHNSKPNAELVIIENMNHVLKIVKNIEENDKSYQTDNYPLSKKLVDILTEFIKK